MSLERKEIGKRRIRPAGIAGAATAAVSSGLVGLAWGAAPAPPKSVPARRQPSNSSSHPAPKHWAFRPLKSVAVPAVRSAAWSANPIDRFILAALERKGLTPAPPADPRTLIRRVYFDLVGLPPAPEDVEAFVADVQAWERTREVDHGPPTTDHRSRNQAGTELSQPNRQTGAVGSSGRWSVVGGPSSVRGAVHPYEALVERLLNSPQYGERWARHWLDVARYADSNGQEGDQDRRTAYHYRDFVIRALNEDLPYDTFVRWQLAGDEYEPDNPRAVAATGFITAGPHTVLDVPMEEEKIRNRLNELDDQVSTTGSAFLGLTVGCARCHDHKYDPIPTRDYYRMLIAFNSGDRAEVPLVPREEAARRRATEQAWKGRLEAAQRELDTWLGTQRGPLTAAVRAEKVERLPLSPEQKTLLKQKPEDPAARELARKHAKALKIEDADYRPHLSEAQQARWDELAAGVKRIEGEKPAPLPTALAMADFGPKPRETWLLDRGDLYLKKERVELGFLTALTNGRPPAEYWKQAKAAGTRSDTTYQRRALADWITDTRHGSGALLARVAVNRVWQHHFGEGLVRTVNDFGLQGEKPSHPALLEFLAAGFAGVVSRELRVASSPNSQLAAHNSQLEPWSLKSLHRLIVLSQAYQMASTAPSPGQFNPKSQIRNPQSVDPENRLLWRRRPRRIEVEAFRDAMLAVAGTLNPQLYGPSFKPPIPAEAIQARNVKDPYPRDIRDTPETRRRTVYMFHKRVVQYPLLQAFDGPDAAASCGRRNVTTVAPQALAVLNEPFVRLRAVELARRLRKEGADPAARVERGYRLALSRGPSAAEREASLRFLRQQTERRAARGGLAAGEVEVQALADFAQVLYGLNEFMYVD